MKESWSSDQLIQGSLTGTYCLSVGRQLGKDWHGQVDWHHLGDWHGLVDWHHLGD